MGSCSDTNEADARAAWPSNNEVICIADVPRCSREGQDQTRRSMDGWMMGRKMHSI